MNLQMRSSERRPFRNNWVDSIPAEWSDAKLGHIARLYAGGTPDKANPDYWRHGTIPWLNSGSVNQWLIAEASEYITDEGYSNSSAKWVPKGALVMALAGQGKTKGMVAYMGIDATCNQSMAAIVPNKVNKVDSRFLLYWLAANYKNSQVAAGDYSPAAPTDPDVRVNASGSSV